MAQNGSKILVKTFGTLCLLCQENAIRVNLPPPWTVLMEQVKHLLHILHMLWTSRIAALSYRAIFIWPWNENRQTKQKKQTNGKGAIWLVYRKDTNARGFCFVKWTFRWKNSTLKNFLEINQYFALTSNCNMIGQFNNPFSI